MIKHKDKPYDYEFECSGRKLRLGGTEGFNCYDDGSITYGYDGTPDLVDEKGEIMDIQLEIGLQLFDSEKKELALYMIERWAKYGNVSLNDLSDE